MNYVLFWTKNVLKTYSHNLGFCSKYLHILKPNVGFFAFFDFVIFDIRTQENSEF